MVRTRTTMPIGGEVGRLRSMRQPLSFLWSNVPVIGERSGGRPGLALGSQRHCSVNRLTMEATPWPPAEDARLKRLCTPRGHTISSYSTNTSPCSRALVILMVSRVTRFPALVHSSVLRHRRSDTMRYPSQTELFLTRRRLLQGTVGGTAGVLAWYQGWPHRGT